MLRGRAELDKATAFRLRPDGIAEELEVDRAIAVEHASPHQTHHGAASPAACDPAYQRFELDKLTTSKFSALVFWFLKRSGILDR